MQPLDNPEEKTTKEESKINTMHSYNRRRYEDDTGWV